MGILVSIISYSKLLGNYNSRAVNVAKPFIISYSKLLGNYNGKSEPPIYLSLYHILNY